MYGWHQFASSDLISSTKDRFGFHESRPKTLKSGVLSKRVQGKTMYWAQRFVMLTKDALQLAVDESVVRDRIALMDISDVWLWTVDDQRSGDSSNKAYAQCQSVLDEHGTLTQNMISKVVGLGSSDNEAINKLEWRHAFSLHVAKYGRTYHLRGLSYEETQEWLLAIKEARQEAFKEYDESLKLTLNQKIRRSIRSIYANKMFQGVLAVILVINFIVDTLEAELSMPPGSDLFDTFLAIDLVFTCIYAVELGLNLYGHWFLSFFKSIWSWFDLVVVTIAVAEVITVKAGQRVMHESLGTNYLHS